MPLIDVVRVMAGLVPAIHAVTWLGGFRNAIDLTCSRLRCFLRPAMRASTWMAGTSPATTELPLSWE